LGKKVVDEVGGLEGTFGDEMPWKKILQMILPRKLFEIIRRLCPKDFSR